MYTLYKNLHSAFTYLRKNKLCLFKHIALAIDLRVCIRNILASDCKCNLDNLLQTSIHMILSRYSGHLKFLLRCKSKVSTGLGLMTRSKAIKYSRGKMEQALFHLYLFRYASILCSRFYFVVVQT